ncbi:MAG: hypothetical protein R2911_36145 [Caldilineaceae bacterium]
MGCTSNEILAALFQAAEKELATIEPPASTLEAHQILLSALNNCSHSVQSAGQGVETIQPAYIQQALEQMNRCAHQVADATDIMLALGQEISGTTTLPAPTLTVTSTATMTSTATTMVAPAATATMLPTETPTAIATVALTATSLPTIAPLYVDRHAKHPDRFADLCFRPAAHHEHTRHMRLFRQALLVRQFYFASGCPDLL